MLCDRCPFANLFFAFALLVRVRPWLSGSPLLFPTGNDQLLRPRLENESSVEVKVRSRGGMQPVSEGIPPVQAKQTGPARELTTPGAEFASEPQPAPSTSHP